MKTKEKFKLGVIGQKTGKCCKGYCLDCEVIRKNFIRKQRLKNNPDV